MTGTATRARVVSGQGFVSGHGVSRAAAIRSRGGFSRWQSFTARRGLVIAILLGLSLALSGCKKKKPPVPPPQAQAPTITDTNVPSTIPEVPVPQPAPEPTPNAPAPTVARKPKATRPKVERKNPPAPPASSDKPMIEEGKTEATPPLIASENPQAAQLRADTNQLLGAAEYNINNLRRTPSKDDQAIIQHIRGFVDQSRQALKDGDIERAHTLAIKAHLMSDELSKK